MPALQPLRTETDQSGNEYIFNIDIVSQQQITRGFFSVTLKKNIFLLFPCQHGKKQASFRKKEPKKKNKRFCSQILIIQNGGALFPFENSYYISLQYLKIEVLSSNFD